MTIKSLHIKKFGKLKDKTLEFDKNLNVIMGKNEAGKSTIAAFIRFMLYGIPKDRQTRENPLPEKDKYIPWDGDGSISGSLTVNYKGRNIVIERDYRNKVNKKPKVYDEATGEPLNIFDNDEPGKVMFDISAEAFERTAFIKQSDVEMKECSELEVKLRNLVTGGDENISYAKTKDFLDAIRRKLENARGGGIIPDLKSGIENLKIDLSSSLSLQNEWTHTQNILNETKQKKEEADKRIEELKNELIAANSFNAGEKYIKIKGAKEEQNENSEKIKAITKNLTIDGFLPDEKFISGIRQSAHDLRLEEERLSMCKKDIVEGQNRLDHFISEEQKNNALSKDYETVNSKLKTAPTTRTRLLLPAGSVLIAAGALPLIAFLLSRNGFLLGSSIAVFIIGIFLFALNFIIKRPNSAEEIAKHYGYKNSGELNDALTHLASVKNEINSTSILLNEAKQREKSQTQICENIKEKLSSFCSQRGINTITPSAVDMICAGIEEELRKIAVLNAKSGQLEERIGGLLDGVKEEDLLSNAKNAPADKPREAQDIEADLDYTRTLQNHLNMDIVNLQNKIDSIYINQKTPDEINNEIENKSNILQYQYTNLSACDIALSALNDSFSELQMTFAPELNKRAGDILELILNDKKRELLMDAGSNVRIKEDGTIREIGYYSAGAIDAAYLSLRLSAAGLIFKDECPPLIFDDVFSRFDDERLLSGMNTLLQVSTLFQTIAFTCRENEAEILKGKANIINLN